MVATTASTSRAVAALDDMTERYVCAPRNAIAETAGQRLPYPALVIVSTIDTDRTVQPNLETLTSIVNDYEAEEARVSAAPVPHAASVRYCTGQPISEPSGR
jgi:hypothetical protein